MWNARYLWWRIQSVLHSGVANQFLQNEGLAYKKKFRSTWMVVPYATVWTLWTWRNQRIFGAQQDKEEEIIELVKYRSFFFGLRAKSMSKLSLEVWKSDPRQALKMQ
ncbi:hypothetical protein SLA2020_426260 [Shorea laevis]